MRLFRERGYTGASVRDIEEATGVHPGACTGPSGARTACSTPPSTPTTSGWCGAGPGSI
ncbi:TetR family transcriptional regulator [Streptomyces sp. NPDC001272]